MRTRKVYTNGWLYWLARHSTLGLVLLDESNQCDVASGRLRAYILNSHATAEFDRSEFRSALGGEVADRDFANLVNRYNQFKSAIGIPLKAPPETAHKNFLRKLGLPEQSVRPRRDNKKLRTTHCYSCHQPLNNAVEVECAECGWILCTCGACGCGWVQGQQ